MTIDDNARCATVNVLDCFFCLFFLNAMMITVFKTKYYNCIMEEKKNWYLSSKLWYNHLIIINNKELKNIKKSIILLAHQHVITQVWLCHPALLALDGESHIKLKEKKKLWFLELLWLH